MSLMTDRKDTGNFTFEMLRRPPLLAAKSVFFSLTGAFFFIGAIFLATAAGQTTRKVGQGSSTANLAPGTPAGSYALSGFESVNPFSGKLNFSLPLLKIGGRGTAGYPMNLNIQRNWIIQHEVNDPNQYSQPRADRLAITHTYTPSDKDDTPNVEVIDLTAGLMKGRRVGANFDIRLCNNLPCYDETLTRLTFTQPDGTEMEFRDVLYGGAPLRHYDGTLQVSRGTHWVSADGSNATFIADSAIYDDRHKAPGVGDPFYPSGTLYLANGTKYIIDNNGRVTAITDANGNRVTPGEDSLGRKVVITASGTGTAERAALLNFKGYQGAARTVKIQYASLESRLSAGYSLTTFGDLFPIQGHYLGVQAQIYNPEVASSVELPDGRSYQFRYNNYGELTEITLPTGGKIEYVWQSQPGIYGTYEEPSVLPSLSASPADDKANLRVYRRVEKRRVYEGGVLQSETVYGVPELFSDYTSAVTVTTYANQNSNLVLINSSKHYYYGNPYPLGGPGSPLPNQQYATWEPHWSYGKELKTEVYDSTGTLLRKTENAWEQGVSLAANPQVGVNARIGETTETLADANLVSKKTFDYDDANNAFNNLTDTYEYDYGSGQPGAFKRRTHTDYLTDSNYTAYTGAHLRGLASQSWVSSDSGGANKVSFSQIEYDNYASDARHAPLVSRGGVIGHDTTNYGASNTRRGNATSVMSYGNAGNLTEPVTVSTQYDILGNVVKAIDAKGNASTIDYTDRFGSPDGEARANTSPTELGGLSSFAVATSATNALSWVTGYSQFDYYTGAIVNTEDINGVVSKTSYNDLLDRPTQTMTAVNTANAIQTTVNYDDANHKVTSLSDLNTLNDNLIKTESFYDGLGRSTETRQYESDGSFTAIKSIVSEMVQDPQTSVWRTATNLSNPYRPGAGEQPVWTTSLSDSLGRGIKVITPDGAIIKTEYSGNTITVTDQAGKKRRSVTNALGQLEKVHEPNDNGLLDVNGVPAQSTDYEYDTLGNLKKVIQGGQVREFLYDSLARLKSAQNPESGLISYQYDNNGNLLQKTDARGVATAYGYDNLNRVLSRTYTGEASGQTTPAVSYFYDNLPNAKGKLIKMDSAISTTEYTSFDILGRVISHKQTTDGAAYTTGYTYNLSGALISETYPSGRVVKNVLDNNGDLSIVQSKKSFFAGYWNYAEHFSYTAAGAVSSMQLGNGKWESTQFNPRLQPTQIALGTVQNGTDNLKLNYTYNSSGQNDNNGNVLSQTITVPTVGQTQGFTATQNYTYDSLNRLKSATEMIGTQTWKQTFLYDRYGNRNFDTANTTTLGTCPANQCNPTVDTTNNRFTTGQGYTYDFSGNVKTDAEGRTFTFDGENKQTKVVSGGQTVGEYFYDGDGKRVKKYVPSTGETTIFVYDAAGKLVAEYSNQISATPQVSYLTSDHLGSPRITTDANGGVTSRRDFMPFGEEVARAGYGSDTVRQKFTAYERDSESGLDFAKARYYGGNYGRFMSPDPLFYTASRPGDPQQFNLYVYVRNNPLFFTDPDGKILRASSVDEDGNLIKLTKKDRKALQENLRKLSPGVKVKKNGEIIFKGKSGESAGTRLVSGLVNSKNTVTIAVNHTGLVQTGAVKSDGTIDLKNQIIGGVSDARIDWDPSSRNSVSTRTDDSPNSQIVDSASDPAIILGHELIHGYNKTRGDAGVLDSGIHTITEGNETYVEEVAVRELRAVGFGYNKPGDITENELRREFGKQPRAAYYDRQSWQSCSGIGRSPNCP
jgi:RHS repeat-associated protein